jgi:hypothetical protein
MLKKKIFPCERRKLAARRIKTCEKIIPEGAAKKTYETELFKIYFQNFSFDLTRYLVNARSNHEFQDLTVTYDTKKTHLELRLG